MNCEQRRRTNASAGIATPSRWPHLSVRRPPSSRTTAPNSGSAMSSQASERTPVASGRLAVDPVVPQYFSRLASSTEADRRVRKIVTMIARPTTTSAAATTMTKNAMT